VTIRKVLVSILGVCGSVVFECVRMVKSIF